MGNGNSNFETFQFVRREESFFDHVVDEIFFCVLCSFTQRETMRNQDVDELNSEKSGKKSCT